MASPYVRVLIRRNPEEWRPSHIGAFKCIWAGRMAGVPRIGNRVALVPAGTREYDEGAKSRFVTDVQWQLGPGGENGAVYVILEGFDWDNDLPEVEE